MNILNICYNVFYAPLSRNVSGYTVLYKYKLLLLKAMSRLHFSVVINVPIDVSAHA